MTGLGKALGTLFHVGKKLSPAPRDPNEREPEAVVLLAEIVPKLNVFTPMIRRQLFALQFPCLVGCQCGMLFCFGCFVNSCNCFGSHLVVCVLACEFGIHLADCLL